MKKLRMAILPVAALCLALPAIGLAGLPEPSNPTVNVPTTIGGVSLGMKLSKADKAWGGNGDCDVDHGTGTCSYLDKHDSSFGNASFSAYGGKSKVTNVDVNAGQSDKGKYVFKGAMLAFQTPEGIGIGDKGSKVKRAYPKAQKSGDEGYVIPGKGQAIMFFATGDGKHITSISTAAQPGG